MLKKNLEIVKQNYQDKILKKIKKVKRSDKKHYKLNLSIT